MNAFARLHPRPFVPAGQTRAAQPTPAQPDLAREQSYADGYAAGRAAAADERHERLLTLTEAARAQFAALHAALDERRLERLADLARLAASAGELLAGVLPRSTPDRARAMLKLALDEHVAPDTLTLLAAPADAALLAELLPELTVEADPAMFEGDLRLRLAEGEVASLTDDRRQALARALREALGDGA